MLKQFKSEQTSTFVSSKNMWNKENCHDKCLMSLALALWKQNKSVTCEERLRWKLLEIKMMMRKIFKTNFSKLFNASRIIIKGGVNNKRWESFLWFILLQRGGWMKITRRKEEKDFYGIVCGTVFNKNDKFTTFELGCN